MNSVFTAKLLQNLRNKKADKGFTLIELLVVVIIIGVLAAVALPNLLAQVGKARETEGKTGVGTITRQQQVYHFENRTFVPVADQDLEAITNPLAITVDSSYFDFDSVASAAGAIDVAVRTTANAAGGTAADQDATASTNGTRAFASRMDFTAGNFTSVLCQTNAVDGQAPADTEVTFTAPTATTDAVYDCDAVTAGVASAIE